MIDINSSTAWVDAGYFKELKRPWKLTTFSLGMGWLIYGALYQHISDWDIGISLLMGGLTYLFAPWSVAAIAAAVRLRGKAWLLKILVALFLAWLTVDGVYVAYHSLRGNVMFRLENFYTSSALYFLAGILWAYRGSLRDLFHDIQKANKR